MLFSDARSEELTMAHLLRINADVSFFVSETISAFMASAFEVSTEREQPESILHSRANTKAENRNFIEALSISVRLFLMLQR